MEARAGNLIIGGNHPVSVQTMYDSSLQGIDPALIIERISSLHALGCDAIRFSFISPDDAAYIGIYHDAYRYSCDGSTPAFCRDHGIDVFPEEDSEPMLLHGALAAIHFPEDAGGSVPEHFRIAVRHHTLGHREMGPYGAILYIADYMEPGRKHLDDDDRRRILSGERLEDMIITIMDMQGEYFMREGIKSAAVSDELYRFIKDGGTL